MSFKGFDVSQWNGNCNLQAAKDSGMNFALIRSSYGNVAAFPSQKDWQFDNNVRKAKEVNLPFGIYHYSYACTVEAAQAEARGFVALLDSIKPIPYIVALDVEEKSQYNLSNSQLEAVTKAFIDVVESAGYFCALYSYESFLCKYSQDFRNRYTIWCANISRKPNIPYGIWQYSFTGRVNGIGGDVDMNTTDVDYVKIIKDNGFNGYEKVKKFTVGDVNYDGKIDIEDIVMTINHINGVKALDEKGQKAADVNYDGVIDITDIATMVNEITGVKPAEPQKPKPVEQPKEKTYVVQKGDTLSGIAAEYGTTWTKIAEDNNIENANLIYVGQKLVIK